MRTSTTNGWRRRATIAALAGAGVFTLGCGVSGELISYDDLPPEKQRYTLEVTTDGVTTVWEYSSATVTAEDAPDVQPCLGAGAGDDSFGPCRPEPLIFLKYELGTELDGTVPTGRPHEITVTGYYQQLREPGDLPVVTDLGVEASFDGGDHWQEVPVEAAGENTFTATLPAASGDTEAVALRVTGTDSEGNTVVQTIPHAYALS